jgi:HSP20 family molecular chaperone IbpA
MNKHLIVLMIAGLGLCLTLTAWLAWSNWQLQQQLDTLTENSSGLALQAEPDWLQRLPPQATPVPPTSPGWDPFAELDRMQQQMNQWLQGSPFGLGAGPGSNLFSLGSAQPDIRIEEDADAFQVYIEVPEGSDIELNTEVDGQRLTVSGTIRAALNNLDNGFNTRFQSSSQFSRQFTLSSPVDSLAMTKETDQDQVIITLPKT